MASAAVRHYSQVTDLRLRRAYDKAKPRIEITVHRMEGSALGASVLAGETERV